VDFCWHGYRTIAEADGAMKYDDQGRERARAQLARDEKFHDEGWSTFHFTWREIYHEPAPAIDRLRRTFARSTPRPRSGNGTRPLPSVPAHATPPGSRTVHGSRE
jgi:very-short-patch-repair endonuclease